MLQWETPELILLKNVTLHDSKYYLELIPDLWSMDTFNPAVFEKNKTTKKKEARVTWSENNFCENIPRSENEPKTLPVYFKVSEYF